MTWASCDFWRHAAAFFCWGMLHMLVAALYSKEIMGIDCYFQTDASGKGFKQMHQEKVDVRVYSEYIFHNLSERSSSHVRI